MSGAWKAAFLECLAVDGRETTCAELVGKSRQHVSRTKRHDPTFREDVALALAAYERSLIESALERQRRRQRESSG